MKCLISFLCVVFYLVGCNPMTVESHFKIESAKMKYINSEIRNGDSDDSEHCDTMAVPGMENVTTIANTLSFKSCDRICKDNYQALPKNYNPDNYLAFPVPGYLGVGRCRGHAIITQKFSLLAVWNSSDNPEKCGPKNMTRECLSMYRGIIRDILSGEKVREVPGFKSLLQFSAHAAIKDILYQNVIGYSHKFNSGLGFTEPKTSSLAQNTFYELIKRTKNNQRPYVGIKTLTGVDHAILIERTAYLKDEQILCVSDPNQRNYEKFNNQPCVNYIKLRNNQPIYVKNGRESSLINLNVFEDEDLRTLNYVKAWKNRCISMGIQNNICKMGDTINLGKPQMLNSNKKSNENISGIQK